MKEEELIKRRKSNMRIYPIYSAIGCDFLFFYSINFLFLTQIKGISVADIVMVDAFYAIFCIFWKIAGAVIVDILGKRKSMILGNCLNALYMVIVMLSHNIWTLFLAEFVCSLAFSLKDISEMSLLNNSIPPTKRSDDIFSKIQGKGLAKYYYISSVAVIIAGFLYEINGYLPITLSLITILIATFFSLGIREVEEENEGRKEIKIKQRIKDYASDLKVSFGFIYKSKRLKTLLIFSAISVGFLAVMDSYEVSLLEEINVSAQAIGIMFAILGIISGIATSRQNEFHQKFRNKTLAVLGISLALSIIIAGLCVVCNFSFGICVLIILFSYIIRYSDKGLLYSLPNRYMRNFADSKIVSKIFASKGFVEAILKAFLGVIASVLLNYMSTAQAMTLLGICFLVTVIIILSYMKTRVGLKPEEYEKEDIEYKVLK